MKRGVNLVIRVRLEIFFIKSLGGKHLPFFSINRGGGSCFKMFKTPLAMHFGYFGQKNTFSWRKIESKYFRNASVSDSVEILHRSSLFFTVLHSFFVLQRVSFWIRDFQFISCFVYFHFNFVYFQFSFLPFLKCFNRLFKPFSRLINDKMNFNRSFVL